MQVMPAPPPRMVVAISAGTPGVSHARVVSMPIPMSGLMAYAEVIAPRKPTSSWTVKTQWISQSCFLICFMARIAIQQATRLSMHWPVMTSPILLNAASRTTMSPILTFLLTSLTSMPVSTTNSLIAGTLLRSSGFEMCRGLTPGFRMPLISFLGLLGSGQMVTIRAKRLRVSKPPVGFSLRNPFSSIYRTMKPIWSICDASMTLVGFFFLVVGFLTQMRLPRLSVLTESKMPLISFLISSRTRCSRPGVPGVWHSFSSNFISIFLLVESRCCCIKIAYHSI